MNALAQFAGSLAGVELDSIAGGMLPPNLAILCPFPFHLPVGPPPTFPTFPWMISV